jgi:nuclear GTP-binding protein
VCKSAPIPGETKVWQYIHLTKRIYLIDCPGVVYSKEAANDMSTVLKGVVRSEKTQDPSYYVSGIL